MGSQERLPEGSDIYLSLEVFDREKQEGEECQDEGIICTMPWLANGEEGSYSEGPGEPLPIPSKARGAGPAECCGDGPVILPFLKNLTRECCGPVNRLEVFLLVEGI